MTPKVAEVLEKASRQLEAAQALDVQRTAGVAVHAAYYAMFHAARAVLLESRGTVSTKHGAVHTAFDALLKDAPPDEQRHRRALVRAYNARVAEDYTTVETSPETAAEVLTLATEFVTYCAHRLGAGPPPTESP